ncbi:MAG: response regulator transcription factor [Lachnospiraceae bacterium]|nr:response regulator transcription factor [Lachnospiraceae bacterium]
MSRVLICDDDKAIVDAIEIYLTQEGYETLRAENGMEAVKLVQQNEDIQLVILDVMMPKMDGIAALKRIREFSAVPVLMLSAKSEDVDKIAGLTHGADDYVTKPFSPMELLARVRSQIRRYTLLGGEQGMQNADKRLKNGGLELDDEKKQVFVDGEEIRLTPMEFLILKLLMENPGVVFSASRIYETVWKEDAFSSDNTVAVHIRHLREKIEINPKEPRYIKVVWGVGYKLEKQ